MLWVDGGRNPHSVSSLVWLFIQGLCCATYSCSIRWSLFSYIVDCSLPLKVHVKYNVLNIWFGYKKYLSSYWRVSSVVDICAKNAASQLLLQVTAANGKTQWANKGLGNHDLLNLYLARGVALTHPSHRLRAFPFCLLLSLELNCGGDIHDAGDWLSTVSFSNCPNTLITF